MKKFIDYITRVSCLAIATAVLLTACANSIPSNFQYKSSVRGERGFEGTFGRQEVVMRLMKGGIVNDPTLALQSALPNAEISVRKWGLEYFAEDWVRYQVLLEADIKRGDAIVKCRDVSFDSPVGAPTLPELLANDGLELQRQLDGLIAVCLDQVRDLA